MYHDGNKWVATEEDIARANAFEADNERVIRSVLPEADAEAVIETIHAYQGSKNHLRTALQDIVNVLGPEPCSCLKHCVGTRAEVVEALRIAREALKLPNPT